MFRRLFKSPDSRRRVSWLIAIVLILPLVLFFHATGQKPEEQGRPGGVAGIIFGKEIPWATFDEQRQSIRRQMEQQLGEMPEVLLPMINQTTWDRLILIEEAKRQRIPVDDLELAARIQQLPPFLEGGRFVPQRYYQFLRLSGFSPKHFEERMRQDLMIEKVLDSVKRSVTVTEEGLRAEFRKAHERLKASAVLVESSAFMDQVSAGLTEEALRAHYEARPELVRIPEQLVIEYAGRTRDDVAPAIQLTDEEVRAFYDEHPEEFADEKGAPRPFEDVAAQARQRATDERIRKQLKTIALDLQDDLDDRKPFEEIVTGRQLTKKTAGPLALGDLWKPGAPEPAILQAVGRTTGNDTSEVVETDLGVHIARVTERVPSRLPPLEEVRETIRQDWLIAQAKQAALAAAEALRRRVTDPPGLRLEEAALAEGRTVRPVEISRSPVIEGLGAVPGGADAAFATPLGQLTPVLELSQGYLVIRPDEVIPADESTFPQEQEQLRQQMVSRQEAERVEVWLADLRSRAQLKSFVDEAMPALQPSPTPPATPPTR